MRYRIEIEPLAGRYIVAFKDPVSGDLVKTLALNRTAGEMIKLHLEGHDVPEIAQILSKRYGVPAERVATDAKALLNSLTIKP
ncbi:MAG: PqqD family protein [Bacteroidales bacterium]|nr:PqqD family protein [Bacteroidales bacterium]